MGMLLIGAAFLCLIAGLMAAVLSPGALVRLLAVPMGVMALIGMWVMPKRKTAPDALLNGLLLLLVLFINLWPAYIVYRFGGLRRHRRSGLHCRLTGCRDISLDLRPGCRRKQCRTQFARGYGARRIGPQR